MAAPTNVSALTAIDLGTLSTTELHYQQRVDDAGVVYTVWVKFTTSPTAKVIELNPWRDAGSTYIPNVDIWLGPAAAPVSYDINPSLQAATQGLPSQWPVAPNTVYFLRIRKLSGTPIPALLSLRLAEFAPASYADGDLIVNDDTIGFPLAILSKVTGSVLDFILDMPTGEAGDSLPSGLMLLEDDELDGWRVLDNQFNTVATHAQPGFDPRPIRSALSGDRWYAGGGVGALARVQIVLGDGTINATLTIGSAMAPASRVTGLGASANNAILYYTESLTSAVHRWDVINNVALSDLTAGPGAGWSTLGPTLADDSMVVLGDGSVVVRFVKPLTQDTVIRYDAAGVVLNTYLFSTHYVDRLTGAVDTSHFWVWLQPGLSDGLDEFREINAADGFTVRSVVNVEFEEGLFQGNSSDTWPGFGHSQSCPFLLYRTTGGGGGGGGAECQNTPPALGCWGADEIPPAMGCVDPSARVAQAGSWATPYDVNVQEIGLLNPDVLP